MLLDGVVQFIFPLLCLQPLTRGFDKLRLASYCYYPWITVEIRGVPVAQEACCLQRRKDAISFSQASAGIQILTLTYITIYMCLVVSFGF